MTDEDGSAQIIQFPNDLKMQTEDGHLHEALIEYWNQKRGEHDLPYRSSVDPVDLVERLPFVALIERKTEGDVPTHQYRLAGTSFARLAGRDPSGRFFHDLYQGDYLDRAVALYEQITADRVPHISRQRFVNDETGDELFYSRLILPLTRDGEHVELFLLHIVPLHHKPGNSDYFF